MRKEKPKKVGRPSLGKDARSIVLQSRVQESKKTAYQKAAKSKGVDLSAPKKQEWGGVMSLVKDLDGNIFTLLSSPEG